MNFQPHPFYILTAAAGRLAHGIGLHRKLDDVGLTQAEIDQRRNVFWIVYIIDKMTSLRVGQPSVMVDDDIGVDLPDAVHNVIHCPYPETKLNIFRCQVELALLESRIYSELYSLCSRKRSDLERLKSVGRLDKELQEWRLSVPIDIQPNEPINCPLEQIPPVFMLHFAYFNCLSTIHRVSIHHASWTSDSSNEAALAMLQDQKINPRVFASQAICLGAARSTIQLLKHFDGTGRFRAHRFIW